MTSQPAPPIQPTAPLVPAGLARPPRRRRVILAATSAAAVAGVSIGLVVATAGRGHSSGPAAGNAAGTTTATVTYRTLTSQQQVDGTLGYSGSYSIVNRASGTLTSLPSTGQVVRQGHVLYRVDTSPVVLLYGSTPAYRDLTEGDSGPDVRSLNADLVALGDASSASLDPTSDYFGAATAAAVDTLQANLGVSQTGTLIFAPGPVRVTSVNATKGTPAQAGAVVLQATSTTRQVTVNLDAAQQSYVKAGDQVTITLPDQATTAGTVTSVSSVATSGSSSGGSSSSGSSGSNSATVQVTIALRDPGATGTLDQAPVQVAITTATAPDVLTVPVTALLAQPGGGYAVEITGPGATRTILPVTVGLFDDAQGLVQVSGSGLQAGQHVVVPASA